MGFDGVELHQWFGYATLSLVLFRLIWGVVGSSWARFTSFIFPLRAVFIYASSLPSKKPMRFAGHNPVGGLMVFLLLFLLLIQGITGLFANDDLFFEGPLYPLISNAVSNNLTWLHKLNFNLLGIAVAIHVLAVFYYLIRKRENLIKPMFTGRKDSAELESVEDRPYASYWKALLAFAISLTLIYLLVAQLPRLAELL